MRSLGTAHALALWQGSYGHLRYPLLERSFDPPFGADSPWLTELPDDSHKSVGSGSEVGHGKRCPGKRCKHTVWYASAACVTVGYDVRSACRELELLN
jgi:hypothetical protein